MLGFTAVNHIGFTALNPTWFRAPELKQEQTPKENKFPAGQAFDIILPNLIHKSRKRNLL
jgi:hypothetical protein